MDLCKKLSRKGKTPTQNQPTQMNKQCIQKLMAENQCKAYKIDVERVERRRERVTERTDRQRERERRIERKENESGKKWKQ